MELKKHWKVEREKRRKNYCRYKKEEQEKYEYSKIKQGYQSYYLNTVKRSRGVNTIKKMSKRIQRIREEEQEKKSARKEEHNNQQQYKR